MLQDVFQHIGAAKHNRLVRVQATALGRQQSPFRTDLRFDRKQGLTVSFHARRQIAETGRILFHGGFSFILLTDKNYYRQQHTVCQ